MEYDNFILSYPLILRVKCISGIVFLFILLFLGIILDYRERFQKLFMTKAKLRSKRGFGNYFQPVIDAPQLIPN